MPFVSALADRRAQPHKLLTGQKPLVAVLLELSIFRAGFTSSIQVFVFKFTRVVVECEEDHIRGRLAAILYFVVSVTRSIAAREGDNGRVRRTTGTTPLSQLCERGR